jgi:hypothetical protein
MSTCTLSDTATVIGVGFAVVMFTLMMIGFVGLMAREVWGIYSPSRADDGR